jgi:hypothetical protein
MSGLPERRVRQCIVAVTSLLSLLLLPSTAGAVTELLPDLRALAPRTFKVTTQNGQRQLRFTTIIANGGAGPFQVTGSRPSTSTAEMTTVTQQIFNDQGGVSRTISTPAFMYWGGDGHNHWHVRDLETYELFPLTGGGRVGTGEKHGFCFFDNFQYNLSLPNAPQSRVYRGCGNIGDLQVVTGLSVGWGDRYNYTLPDQYINITNVANGQYRLVYTVDAQGHFTESRENNNVHCTDIQIKTGSVIVLRRGCS